MYNVFQLIVEKLIFESNKMPATLTATKSLGSLAKEAYLQNRRLAAPLAGFPGCDLLNVSIKVAQQNHELHYSVIESLVQLLAPDMAFMMMDLSVEANALGLPVRFPLQESSTVENHPVRSVEDLQPFRKINILRDARVQSYIKTVEMMSMGLPKKVLKGAYVIGPATLAGLMESAQQVAMDSVLAPEKLHAVCSFSTEIIKEYAMALANAGADVICVLEPTGSILGPQQFRDFSANYVSQILDSYKHTGANTIYHVCGNTMHLIDGMVESGVAALSLDSPDTGVDLAKAAKMLPEDVVVMGNVNPTSVMKEGTVEQVRQVTTKLLEQMRDYPNFMLSTACDLPPGTPVDNMLEFMKTAREFK